MKLGGYRSRTVSAVKNHGEILKTALESIIDASATLDEDTLHLAESLLFKLNVYVFNKFF